jgi:hypothetical protein
VKITMSVTLSTNNVVDATAARLADSGDRSHTSNPGDLHLPRETVGIPGDLHLPRETAGIPGDLRLPRETAGVKAVVFGCLSARPTSARGAGVPGYPHLGVGKSR